MTQQQNEKGPEWPLVIGLLAILALVVVFVGVFHGGSATGNAPASLATQDTPSFPTDVPGAKETLEAQEATEQAILLLTPSPGLGTLKPTLDVTPEPIMTADVPRQTAGAGTIIWGFPPTFPSIGYQLTNKWVEVNGTTVIEVFAGARRNVNDWQDVSQGLVIVLEETPQGSTISGNEYETPTKSGPIQITDAQGERLILRTRNGVTFYFDVPARQFVDSLIATVIPPLYTVTPPLPLTIPAPSAYPPLSAVPPTPRATVRP